ncbi:MAG TPA: biotin-dependent carboxyltransferase family protein, partial [Kofleriaceae bacterium]|nr:biotin-dependent carboxyltransferase family protein [Kofleriaceae bacterium]
AGNADFAPAIEILGRLIVRAEAPTEVATDRTPRRVLDGELVIESEPQRVSYLAIRGGVAAPLVLGSASAHLAAELGGVLAAGARIGSAGAPDVAPATGAPLAAVRAAIRVLPGPDAHAFAPDALAALVSAPYRIAPASDRVGTRLVGPVLARSSAPDRSRPTVRGAIEVPRDGQPIVLGPEHPTTGGYPIVATICTADLDRFFAIRIGGDVVFEVGHAATSRARS